MDILSVSKFQNFTIMLNVLDQTVINNMRSLVPR